MNDQPRYAGPPPAADTTRQGVAAATAVLVLLTATAILCTGPRRLPADNRPAATTLISTGTPTSSPAQRRRDVPPLSAGAVRVGAGGTAWNHNIPVGYQHTPDGAAAAATNLLVAYFSPLMFQPKDRTDTLAVLATPQTTAALARSWNPHLNPAPGNATIPSPGPASQDQIADINLYQLDPQLGAWRLDTYTAQQARVVIWAALNYTLLSDHGQHHTRWLLEQVQLTWTGSDWKLTEVADLPDPPDPHLGWGTAPDPQRKADLLAGAGITGMHAYLP